MEKFFLNLFWKGGVSKSTLCPGEILVSASVIYCGPVEQTKPLTILDFIGVLGVFLRKDNERWRHILMCYFNPSFPLAHMEVK